MPLPFESLKVSTRRNKELSDGKIVYIESFKIAGTVYDQPRRFDPSMSVPVHSQTQPDGSVHEYYIGKDTYDLGLAFNSGGGFGMAEQS